MAYLHCHNCDWQQDDFWSKDGYNPFRKDIVAWWKSMLFQDTVKFDKDAGGVMSGTDAVVREMRKAIINILTMKVKTEEDWQKVRETWECPGCGKQGCWDID